MQYNGFVLSKDFEIIIITIIIFIILNNGESIMQNIILYFNSKLRNY